MDKRGLTPRAALCGYNANFGTNTVAEQTATSLISIAFSMDQTPALESVLDQEWGLSMPDPHQSKGVAGARAIWMRPGQILLMLEGEDTGAVAAQSKIGTAGYTTDQTGAWVLLRVSGPDTPTMLERICQIDLDVRPFPEGASASTRMDHLGVTLLRLGPKQFLLMSGRSFAGSLSHLVETSFANVMAQ